MSEFDKASKDIDQEAFDAGQSIGGIYGKSAAEALTTDNQTVEIYDPAVVRDNFQTDSAAKRAQPWKRAFLFGSLGLVLIIFTLIAFHFLNQ